MASPIKFRAEVSRIDKHSDDVFTYEFRCLDKRPRHKAGQFLHLALDDYDASSHWPESRVFTIANGATNRDCIRLTIAGKGKFTHRILKELEVGREVWMKAPYGEFIVHCQPEGEVALIAGGTGVSPFVAFMEDALVQGVAGDVWLFYGAREPGLLVYRRLADHCAEVLPGFHVKYYVESGSLDNAINGRINLGEVCGVLRDVKKTTFYLCGPPEMIRFFSSQLSNDFGVLDTQIKVDDWG